MKIKLTSVYVDDQEKALRFYIEVMGFVKKADFSQGPFRWLTVVSPEDPDGTELQLALNNNPAGKAYQEALFQQGQPAAMFHSDDVQADYERMKTSGAEFTMPPKHVPPRSRCLTTPAAISSRSCSRCAGSGEIQVRSMSDREQYAPGPASGVRVRKGGEKWTLILVRDLRHSPEKVWEALTEPAHLHEWAPFDADRTLGTAGASVNLTWAGTQQVSEAMVMQADRPKVLEYGDIRWELEPLGGGTRLRLWHSIDRRFVSWGAAGWQICFDVLDRFLAGEPIGRIVGADAMKFDGWKRLTTEYAKQFDTETPN